MKKLLEIKELFNPLRAGTKVVSFFEKIDCFHLLVTSEVYCKNFEKIAIHFVFETRCPIYGTLALIQGIACDNVLLPFVHH